MKKLVLPLAIIMISGAAIAAEVKKEPVKEPVAAIIPGTEKLSVAELKERTEWATEFHKVRNLRATINRALEAVGSDLNEEQRLRYLSDIQKIFKYDQVEKASIDAMARIFTADELRVMVDYYKKPEAKTASNKMPFYEQKLTEEMKKALDDAFVQIKYPKK